MATGTAAVIGGSVAGLLAARVLADHFDRVIVVERDAFPDSPEGLRRGLPQACHQHLLLARGRLLLEQLFPGFDAELATLGCPLVDYTRDCLLCSASGRLPRFASGLLLRLCRRPLLDWVLRRRLAARPGIHLLAEHRALGLLSAADDARVTDVRVTDARVTDARVTDARVTDVRVTGILLEPGDRSTPPRPLAADLVVDASGRRSQLPHWLQALGCEPPATERVDPFLGYASRLYQRPRTLARDWRAVEIAARPPDNPRAAGLWEVEADRWLLTLIGTAGHYPPLDEPGFLAFAAGLADPVVHEAIRAAEPLSPIRGQHGLESRWRHYERLRSFPDGLVVLGDAFCAFNPTHGQGMTVAALGALALDRQLRRGYRPGLGRRLQRQLAGLLGPVWLLATSDDRRWPGTLAARAGPAMGLLHWYQDRCAPLAPRSPALVKAFLSVANLVASPWSLLHPRLLAELAWLSLERP